MRTLVYFAFAPTDIKCYFAYVCKPVFFVFLWHVNVDWCGLGENKSSPGKQGSDLAGVSAGLLSGAHTVPLPPQHRQEVT